MVPADRARGDGLKLEHGKFRMNTSKKTLYHEGSLHGIRVPGEVVVSSSGDIQNPPGLFPERPAVGEPL